MPTKINVLAYAAHPDDVEISISGTMIKHKKNGLSTGIIDLTRIVLCNAVTDRHPDHGKGHRLVKEACFLSGLVKIEVKDAAGNSLPPWRPKAVYAYIQDHYIQPDLVIDVTAEWEQRMKSLMCFESQFFNPASKEPETPISTPAFLQHIEGRAVQFGRFMNVHYAEGFTVVRPAGVSLLTDLI